jgi:hypothetical protein
MSKPLYVLLDMPLENEEGNESTFRVWGVFRDDIHHEYISVDYYCEVAQKIYDTIGVPAGCYIEAETEPVRFSDKADTDDPVVDMRDDKTN